MTATIAQIAADAASVLQSLTAFSERPAVRVGAFEIAPTGRAAAKVDDGVVEGELYVTLDSWTSRPDLGTDRVSMNATFKGEVTIDDKTWKVENANHIRVVFSDGDDPKVDPPLATLRSAKGGAARRETSKRGAAVIADAIRHLARTMTVADAVAVLHAAHDAKHADDALRNVRAALHALNHIPA